jgi:alkylhydroperoxidase family enzyme
MERLMGHAPHILAPWVQLEEAFFGSTTFPAELLEQVRRTLAFSTGCRYCQAKAGPAASTHSDPKVAAAVELAQLFAVDHRAIDDATVARFRSTFSTAELAELLAFMGFMWAGGTFGAALGLQPRPEYESSCSIEELGT